MARENKSQLKIGVILNYVNIILGNLIPIFYTPIMLSLLGQSEYGLYKLSSSVISYLSLISLGIGSAVTRYLIKYRVSGDTEGEEKVLGLFMTIFRIIAIVAFIVGTIITFNLDVLYGKSLTAEQLSRMQIIVFLMVCNTGISFAISPYVSVVNAHERFIFLQCMHILVTCVAPIVNLVVLFFGFASIGMAVSTLAINVLSQFIYYMYVRNSLHLKARYRGMPVNLLKEILTFSFWVFVSNIAGQLYNATDTVMIGAIPVLATTGVAVYNIGATFNNIILSFATGVSALLTPKANRMVFSGASNEELTELSIRIGRIQGYIVTLLVSGFIAFGRPFLDFYVGKGYEDAYWVAVLVIIPNMIPLIQSMCLSIIIAQNKHRFRSIMYVFIAILNVIGSWFLLKKWGIIGAAFMTGAALVIGNGFLMNWYYYKKTGLNMPYFWKKIGVVFIIPTILCVITLLLSTVIDFYNIITLIIGIAIYSIVYILTSWKFVMNQYEKDLFWGSVKSFINKLKR